MPQINAADGTELFYRDWGAGDPIVFVHGLMMSGDMWKYQMIHLADPGCRVLAPDRRGHGRSDDPGRGYGFDTLADDLAMLLTRLDLSRVTLVGHSMGGGEITRYLSRHGDERVARIVLLSSTVPALEVAPPEQAEVLDRLRTSYGDWLEENAALSFGDASGCSVSPMDRQRTIQDWTGVSLQAAVACTATNLSSDFRAELAELAVPVLLLHGDGDAFAPLETCARRAADLIPDSRLVVYEGAAHMPQLSHREQLNADLLEFARPADRGLKV